MITGRNLFSERCSFWESYEGGRGGSKLWGRVLVRKEIIGKFGFQIIFGIILKFFSEFSLL